MKRKIYNELLNWKKNNIDTPLMVVGARQIGKTYTINEFCEKEFNKYVYINLFEDKNIINIYNEEISSTEKFQKLELYLGKKIDLDNTIIFFDEIQESEELISSLKFFCESNRPFKIICAGSLLGVKINRFKKSFPVGKVRILEMNSMSFDEFLYAYYDSDLMIKEIEKCYSNNKKMLEPLHNKLMELYNIYLIIGGLPASVANYLEKKDMLIFDRNIIKFIISYYLKDMNKYVTDIFESTRIENIYNSIPSQLGNPSDKFQYSKIKSGARAREYESAINWLLSSKMVFKCSNIKKCEKPLKVFINNDVFKLYLSDVGILSYLLEISYKDLVFDEKFMYMGIIAENYVANELLRNGISLYYWNSGNKAEIDFVLNINDKIIPIEVKSSNNNQAKSLKVYIEKYNPNYSIRISSKNFGFENNIKSVPLYAVFCIK